MESKYFWPVGRWFDTSLKIPNSLPDSVKTNLRRLWLCNCWKRTSLYFFWKLEGPWPPLPPPLQHSASALEFILLLLLATKQAKKKAKNWLLPHQKLSRTPSNIHGIELKALECVNDFQGGWEWVCLLLTLWNSWQTLVGCETGLV